MSGRRESRPYNVTSNKEKRKKNIHSRYTQLFCLLYDYFGEFSGFSWKKWNTDNVDTLRHNDNTTVLSSAGDAQIFLICLRQTRVYGKRMLLYVYNKYHGGRRGHDFRVTRACFFKLARTIVRTKLLFCDHERYKKK